MNHHQRYTQQYIRDVDSWLQLKEKLGLMAAYECLTYFSIPSVWAWWTVHGMVKRGVG